MTVRPGGPEDLALIHHSWSRCLRDSAVLKHVPSRLYFSGMKREIDRILSRAQISVLCNSEEPTQIFSYAVTERLGDELVIHFAYTKSFYWKMGLMRKLLQAIEPEIERKGAVITCFAPSLQSTDWCVGGGSFWLHLRDKYKFVFNPFLKEHLC